MILYIDPGTGSMLFTILIGVLGAATYLFRNLFLKIKFLFSGGNVSRTDTNQVPFVIFTDSKRYWSIFKPICDEMESRGEQLLYLTAEEDDPLLYEKYENIKAEFIGMGNKAFAIMNMVKADIVLSSTPGLDVYQWKRSRDVKWYVHVLHAASDVTLYRMFGIDYYDAMLLNGEFQIEEVRKLEALRELPSKEVVLVGLPHLDSLWKRLKETDPARKQQITVLLAPSWGDNGILSKYGRRIIDRLVETGFSIIIRPHPQTFISEKDIIEPLLKLFPETDSLKWDRSVDNFDSLHKSDILISDYSGVVFDFALVFDKPIIYADISFDNGVYDSWWLEDKEWIFTILDKLGVQLTEDNLDDIKEVIYKCLSDNRFKDGREQARREAWANKGRSVESISDYLVKKRDELRKAEAIDMVSADMNG